ncbi:MAG: tetratricopeptide repeat protein [Bacteroidetes bacterium]|jgi:serine phosphatase RsbU (regulator of sigma subunit)|nr:tetratricopeptide repeat protein [Bacteroidota bacterium]MCA6443655.1 tetratricopeptide repeat protein [Bacteroidota bacterium]
MFLLKSPIALLRTKILVIMLMLWCLKFNANNTRKIDSLYTLLKTTTSDTIKVDLRLKIAALLMKEDSLKGEHEIKIAFAAIKLINDKSFALKFIEKIGKVYYNNRMLSKARSYWNFGLAKAKDENNAEWQAKFYLRIADFLQREDYSKQCIIYFDSALVFAKKSEEKILTTILMLKGRAHYDNGDYKLAMENYIESQRLFEKNKWQTLEYGHLLHFIGSVFKRQGFNDKALTYYEKELKLARDINNKSLEAEALYLCAAMYGASGDLIKESVYLNQSVILFKEEKNDRMLALLYGNLASNLSDRKEFKKAIDMCLKSLNMYIELDEKEGLSSTYRTLGDLHVKINEPKKALVYFKQAMDAAMQIETKQLLNRADITESMAFAYADMGDYKRAFDLILDHRVIRDSLNNENNAEYLQSLEKEYQTEKQEKEIALLSKDKKIQEEEILRQTSQRKSLTVVIILVLIVAAISMFAFINNRKKSNLLAKQVNEINYQNAIIKEKNKDITDSIQYAKRLQEAVFPETERLNAYFAESFVLFRPKDIVSGDFYWFEEIKEKAFLVVGDCTGHGVPGAFMSILGHNLLNQIIIEEKVTSPAQVLRILDTRVTNALNKKGNREENNDGMDIIICVIDKQNLKLTYAGANRPLIIKRGNQLIDLKPTKNSIGGIQLDSVKVFRQQEIDIQADDALYLFSDGYADQFGGPKGKKFKYKQLTEFILSIGAKPLNEQKSILLSTLENWKGQLEQVDDVCIIGVKI